MSNYNKTADSMAFAEISPSIYTRSSGPNLKPLIPFLKRDMSALGLQNFSLVFEKQSRTNIDGFQIFSSAFDRRCIVNYEDSLLVDSENGRHLAISSTFREHIVSSLFISKMALEQSRERFHSIYVADSLFPGNVFAEVRLQKVSVAGETMQESERQYEFRISEREKLAVINASELVAQSFSIVEKEKPFEERDTIEELGSTSIRLALAVEIDSLFEEMSSELQSSVSFVQTALAGLLPQDRKILFDEIDAVTVVSERSEVTSPRVGFADQNPASRTLAFANPEELSIEALKQSIARLLRSI